jgi:hypothetical protein
MTVIRKFPYTFTKQINLSNSDNPIYQNLSIDGIPDVLIYENSAIVTRNTVKNISRFDYFSYLDKYYQDTFIVNETTPYLICFCDGSFTHLDQINYDEPIIQYLNKKGLHIYFWELIVYKTKNTCSNTWLIEPSNTDTLENIFLKNKDSIIGFESTDDNIENLKCFDFDKISNFVNRNKLTNVTIYTGNYQNSLYFKKSYPELNFKVKDIAVASMFNPSEDKLTSYTYIDNLQPPTVDEIEYKFCSWNKRYAGHRNLIAAHLIKRSSLVSYNADSTDFFKDHKMFDIKDPKFYFWKDINKKLWFSFEDWKIEHPELFDRLQDNVDYLEKVRYLSIDRDIKHQWFTYEEDLLPSEYYHKAFCSVVTETVFAQPCGHFADKTLNAIKCFRPFVLAAPPKTLEYLQSLGVKTFSKYWDESYDDELNHEQRLLKILKVIDYIDSKSLDELKDMYIDMESILKHNYKIIKSLRYQD